MSLVIARIFRVGAVLDLKGVGSMLDIKVVLSRKFYKFMYLSG